MALTVDLYCGDTFITTWEVGTTGSAALYEHQLTAEEIAAITAAPGDWSDLRIWQTGTGVEVEWFAVEFKTPDPTSVDFPIAATVGVMATEGGVTSCTVTVVYQEVVFQMGPMNMPDSGTATVRLRVRITP